MSARPRDLFAGGGEMGALMRAIDWSKTRLGPVDTWPKSLRTMLGVVLGSRFPMLLWWGPDLLHLYNDAYRPILRDKHPASLAAPAAEIWAEVWEVAGPMAQSVLTGGGATWTEDLQLFIASGGMAEETYFTFSYSPVPDDDGGIGGILNTVQETTAKVQSERQIRTLHELAARAAEAKSEDEAYVLAAEALSANELDLPFALLFAREGNEARLAASAGWKGYGGPERVRLDEKTGGWPLSTATSSGRGIVLDDLAERFGTPPPDSWGARPERAIVLPLFGAGPASPSGFLVAGIGPHRTLDVRYQTLFEATADRLGSVLANARAYEAEKRRAEALAEIDRAKTAFFSNVSHEFRTPLTLILGPLEDALGRPQKALQGEGLAAVHRSALRLLRLVNSLLDVARIEAGRLELSLVETDLAALTADLVSTFRSIVERAGLDLVVDCRPIAAPVYVDPNQWEKIVLNLVSNAFKFTLQGSITVSLREADGRAELTVADTGSGIPAHELPRIFERFHRVEGAKGRSFEGSGIGLSLVQELVRLHGGEVRVASTEGAGSTFTVSLPTGRPHHETRIAERRPAVRTELAAPYVLEASQWAGAGADAPGLGEVPDRGTRARVLVVDDNADMREYLVRLLSPHWRVDVAGDGETALASARENPPDLVLSDVMMPGLDGFGLLRALREHPRTSSVPVVLLSARAGEESLLEGLDTGADDYLVKPFAARELLARVRTHLDLARLRREWSRELEAANKELEAFSYSVSHDLRAPLRAIDGFSMLLLEDHGAALGEKGRHYLERVRAGTQRMGRLIEDLLGLSRITRAPLQRSRVDVGGLATQVAARLAAHEPTRPVEFRAAPGLAADADPRLLEVALENLLGNAWKFTSKEPAAHVEVGSAPNDGPDVFFVRDNGAGFDPAYASRLFAPFQRLHSETEFQGTGIGLATVQRIVVRHGGRIWAESERGRGATFFFTLASPS